VIKAKDSKNEDYDNFRMGKIWLKAGDQRYGDLNGDAYSSLPNWARYRGERQ